MNRLLRLVTTTITAALILAPMALASDPLLSGYGGPGNGEQALLGSTLTGGGGSKGGGGGAAAPKTLRAQAPAPAATGPSAAKAPALSSRPPATRDAKKRHRAAPHKAAPAPAATHPAPASALPRVVAYPSRAGGSGALPLSLSDILVAVLAATALILLAVGLRRLPGPPGGGRSSDAQAGLG